jgi:hypothetical protein
MLVHAATSRTTIRTALMPGASAEQQASSLVGRFQRHAVFGGGGRCKAQRHRFTAPVKEVKISAAMSALS